MYGLSHDEEKKVDAAIAEQFDKHFSRKWVQADKTVRDMWTAIGRGIWTVFMSWHRAELRGIQKVHEERLNAEKMRAQHFLDAVITMWPRCPDMSAEELAQLGVGQYVKEDEDTPATVLFYDLEDAKTSIDFAMKNQATGAKFRQMKDHFVKHQKAVTAMLDRLDDIGKQNVITTEDVRKLRQLRTDLALTIRRNL